MQPAPQKMKLRERPMGPNSVFAIFPTYLPPTLGSDLQNRLVANFVMLQNIDEKHDVLIQIYLRQALHTS